VRYEDTNRCNYKWGECLTRTKVTSYVLNKLKNETTRKMKKYSRDSYEVSIIWHQLFGITYSVFSIKAISNSLVKKTFSSAKK